MTVDKLGDNKLLIKLDESDMENFELDFGKMSFKNEDNQKVIIGLMRDRKSTRLNSSHRL